MLGRVLEEESRIPMLQHVPSAEPGGCVPVCFPGLYKLNQPKEKPSQTIQPAVVEAEESEEKREVTYLYAHIAPSGFVTTSSN